MTPKLPHALLTMLWLSILLLLLLEFCKSRSHLGNTQHAVGIGAKPGSSLPSASHHHGSINRKVLASRFDFSPFRKRRGKSSGGRSPQLPEPPDNGREIDPRYGVEKRLVPTGPNPLHH
ncbi:CLAVATA3/ESR (CLE)-related protein 12 [Rhodamnia argentea]|uniref:CLAVATA3/ESR (CLE)-related protein 12 n=1 Tax=Rhodamnia argentea TaxID=178133 RepID=A0A8B8QA62_9MYRT|nr:CLAVATA3/ESR (CLE)-related protein 12 [Rhodamnia argentea]